MGAVYVLQTNLFVSSKMRWPENSSLASLPNEKAIELDTVLPDVLLDEEGYPTEEYIAFVKGYNNQTMLIMEFVEDVLQDGWYFGDWAFKLFRKYKGKRKLLLSTGGWSGNEEIIDAILGNVYLTHSKMKYIGWKRGGHYTFEIMC